MILWFFACLVSFGALVAAIAIPLWANLFLPALIAAIIAALGFVRSIWRAVARRRRPSVVVDGSNVMYWKGNKPQLQTLRDVLRHLQAQGYVVGIMFDANAGYLLTGKYRHDRALGKMLGLDEDHVMVVSKGTPADPQILSAARQFGARVVTNDQFRDWAEMYPEVHDEGYLIKGGYRDGHLWLDTEPEPVR